MSNAKTHISGPNRVVGIHSRQAPSLRDLQHRMAGFILELPVDDSGLDALFALPVGVSSRARVQVYAQGYPARLHDALLESFPAVEHVVGHAAFHQLEARYLCQRPPLSYNLNDAGAGLPHFLRNDPLAADLPFLPDLAELEWHLVTAFHAHLLPPLDAAQLATWDLDDWEGAVLRLQAGVTVLDSPWPVREIWEARETPIESIDIDLKDRADHVLIYRDGFEVRCESLPAGEALALKRLHGGRPLGEVAAELAARGQAVDAVSAWFRRWMSLGLFVENRPIHS